MRFLQRALASILAMCILQSPSSAEDHSYRLPTLDLKNRVIWGSKCEEPAGSGLSFGGQDQEADIGAVGTQILVDGKWKPIGGEPQAPSGETPGRGALRILGEPDLFRNPFKRDHAELMKLIAQQRALLAQTRRSFLEGEIGQAGEKPNLIPYRPQQELMEALSACLHKAQLENLKLLDTERIHLQYVEELVDPTRRLANGVRGLPSASMLESMRKVQVALEQIAEELDAEPPGRTLSPIVYDSKTKLYVMFGGDHLDYLTNDTWTFDPTTKKWQNRHPGSAPPPRANHELKADGDGKIVLSGGYTYANNTDYMGGQYRDWKDGEWVFDIANNSWSGPKKGEPVAREYRTGPFLPEFFLQGDPPKRKEIAEKLESLPVNTWVATKPPQLPQMQRDWGTAVLDPDHDLILRFSGGHCAHGGSDVLMYHINTNRWELPFPVEFPLGQLYSNTSYPEGFNLNQRPWVTGHTYQSYGYDPNAHKMLFTGHSKHTYVYDPLVADWTGRIEKPKSMSYDSCFYTLTICPTPQGLVCWTQQGQVLRFDAKENQWKPIEQRGEKLPGSSVDSSTVLFDSKRNRLLFARKDYGDKVSFNGQLHSLDLANGEVKTLSPAGSDKCSEISYLCQLRYDEEHDLVLCGCTLPPDADGVRRTPAFDCKDNRWISLKITGDDPSGKSGRNVSLGMMYDAKRKLFWAVDTHSNVFVLRLDPDKADLKPL